MINRDNLFGMVKNLNGNQSSPKPNSKSSYIGRVTDIILDNTHPQFSNLGGYNALGTVFFEEVNKANNGINNKTATPFFPNIKNYPLVNELIYVFRAPVPTLKSQTYSDEWYYLSALDLWNHPHHNASPNPSAPLGENTTNDYQESEGGLIRQVKDNSTDIDLNSPNNTSNNTFKEIPNIHPLIAYAGDIIYEGRFGNSIRFGNTVKTTSNIPNNWSESGDNGNPILILRNGQPKKTSNEGWVPISEDINQDLSSIYLTSNQKIPLTLAKSSLPSFSETPNTKTFTQPQIILNSDRIILGAKKDNIILNSNKALSLASNESVNIDTPEFIIDAKIKLGSNKADQKAILGNKLKDNLDIILQSLITLISVLQQSQIWPGGVPVIDPKMSVTALNVKTQLEGVKNNLEGILSSIVTLK